MTIIILYIKKNSTKNLSQSQTPTLSSPVYIILVAIYILLNWKITYHSELPIMNEQLMVSSHVLTSFPRTMQCRSFEVSVSLTKIYYLLQVLCSTTQRSCNDLNIFTLNVKYLAKNSLHTTFSGHLRNYDCNQLNLEYSCKVYSCIPDHLYRDVLQYTCH